MITLNERLTAAYKILIEKRVFFDMYNQHVFCKCPDEQLQFQVNYLSLQDVKIIVSVCEIYSLKFGINYIPSNDNNTLSVIFRDDI